METWGRKERGSVLQLVIHNFYINIDWIHYDLIIPKEIYESSLPRLSLVTKRNNSRSYRELHLYKSILLPQHAKECQPRA